MKNNIYLDNEEIKTLLNAIEHKIDYENDTISYEKIARKLLGAIKK